MRITDYKRISDLKPEDIILLDSDTEGTRAITASELSKQLNKVLKNSTTTTVPLPLRRMTYRGKNLGTFLSDKHRQAIRNGTFDDLYIGDYWKINGRTWYLADFNTWLTTSLPGNKPLETPHICVICVTDITGYSMNDTNVSTGGWYESKGFKTVLPSILSSIVNDFGATSILSHVRNDATNTLTQIDIPTAAMMTGFNINACDGDGKPVPYALILPIALFNNSIARTCLLQDTHDKGFYNLDSAGHFAAWNATSTSFQINPILAISGE